MATFYNAERYELNDCELRLESLFINELKTNTGTYIFPFHKHNDFLEISLILKGEEVIEIKDERYIAKEGDIIIKNAGYLHQEIAGNHDELLEFSIGISGVKVHGFPDNVISDESIVPVITVGETINVLKELVLYIQKLYKSSITTYTPIIHFALQTFISIVLLNVDKYGVVKKSRNVKEKIDPQIADILKYIDQNFQNQISLDNIAEMFYISPYYLAKKFKSTVGYTVNSYIQSRRLGMAEQRLAFEDTPIKQIAAECGYPNLKHFYSVFKVKTGHTPNEFRNLIKGNAPDAEE